MHVGAQLCAMTYSPTCACSSSRARAVLYQAGMATSWSGLSPSTAAESRLHRISAWCSPPPGGLAGLQARGHSCLQFCAGNLVSLGLAGCDVQAVGTHTTQAERHRKAAEAAGA